MLTPQQRAVRQFFFREAVYFNIGPRERLTLTKAREAWKRATAKAAKVPQDDRPVSISI